LGYSPLSRNVSRSTDESIINYNLFENDSFQSLAQLFTTNKETVLSKVLGQLFVSGWCDCEPGQEARQSSAAANLLDFSDDENRQSLRCGDR
jgi:hypothetical protein